MAELHRPCLCCTPPTCEACHETWPCPDAVAIADEFLEDDDA